MRGVFALILGACSIVLAIAIPMDDIKAIRILLMFCVVFLMQIYLSRLDAERKE